MSPSLTMDFFRNIAMFSKSEFDLLIFKAKMGK